jgi:hypothetical protein
MRNRATRVAAVAAIALAIAVGVPTEAHKPITSKYTYNADVFPIVRDRCASCHVDGGIAPMSLLAYKDALPWAESIRQELTGESMPPWFADPAGPAVKGGHPLSASEIDTIVTWATGGTPEGDAATRPAPRRAAHDWTAGPPDTVLAVDSPFTILSEVQEVTHDFAIATAFDGARWIRGADLLPGDPTVVRDAMLMVEGGPTILAWVPGEGAAMSPDGTGFLLPAGARLTLRVHYRKSWQDERVAKEDRSQIGLYFTRASAAVRKIDAVDSDAASDAPASVLAVRATIDRPYGSLEVRATRPGERGIVLLRLHRPRPGWPRRYWLEHPIQLPACSRIEVVTTPILLGPDEIVRPPAGRLKASVDVVTDHVGALR